MATISKCQYDDDCPRGVHVDEKGRRSYKLKWNIELEGSDKNDLTGWEVLQMAHLVSGPNMDRVHAWGESYTFLSGYDTDSFVSEITCDLKYPLNSDAKYIFVAEVSFSPPKNDEEREKEKQTKPNPMDWSTEYWIEWIQDDVVVEKATCITHLPHLERGFADPENPTEEEAANEPGAIVNAAGQQTIDPITRPRYHAVLCAEKNYPNAFVALQMNSLYGKSMNETEFLGQPARTWRYLYSDSGRRQSKEVDGVGTVRWYSITTKLEYNKDTWDHFILNNGMSCFRKAYAPGIGSDYIYDPRYSDPKRKMLFPTITQQLKDPQKFPENETLGSTPATPAMSDLEEVNSSEPVNLDTDGTQIKDETIPGNHIQYRDLREKDFNEIESFLELVDEYEEFING